MNGGYWRFVPVNSVCKITSGHGFTPKEWSGNGLPIIRIQNLNGSDKFNYFAGQSQPEWLVEPGELLFAWAGVAGVSFGPKIWSGNRGVLNQHIFRITPTKDVEKKFLLLALRAITASIEKKGHGFKSSLLHIHKRDIADHLIPLPPLPEQRAIVEILDSADAAVRKTQALIDAKIRYKCALADELLNGTRRFAEFEHTGPWRKVALANLASITMGQSPASADYNTEGLGLPLIQGNADIKNSRLAAKVWTSQYTKKCAVGDLIMTVRAPVGAMALAQYQACLGRGVCGIHVNRASRLFVYHALVRAEPQWKRVGQGFSFAAVNSKDLRQFEIQIPPTLEEQERIAECLSLMDKEISLLQAQCDARKLQKQGLMDRLLTGKVRLPEFRTEDSPTE